MMSSGSFGDDAREFGRHIRHGGDWRYGMLVARWVEKQQGQKPSPNGEGKRSTASFAKEAGCSQQSVARYLNAWECAAENGYVPPSASINPGEEIGLDDNIHTPELWTECYRVGNRKKPETNNPDGSNGPPEVAEAKYKRVVARKIHAASRLMELAPEDMVRLPDDAEILRVRSLINVLTVWVDRIEAMRSEVV